MLSLGRNLPAGGSGDGFHRTPRPHYAHRRRGSVAVLARAQQTAMPMIGFLTALSEAETLYQMVPFRRGLSEGGFVEGQNVAIEYRFADGEYERLTSLAAEFTLLAAGWSAWSKARRVFARIYAQSGCHSHAGQSRSASRSGPSATGRGR